MIFGTDWSERENYFELRRKIRAEAEFLKKIVLIQEPEWLRQEILKSNIHNLEAIRIWLEWEKGKEITSFETQQNRVIKQLPKPEGLMLMARHLLLSEKLPTPELIRNVFRENPLIMMDAFKGCLKKGALNLSKVTGALRKNMTSEPEKVLEWMIFRNREDKLCGVFTLKSYRQYARRFLEKLFQHPDKALLISKSLLLKLEDNPEIFPESPYSLKLEELRKNAMASLKSGNYSDSSIHYWIAFAKSPIPVEQELRKTFLDPHQFNEPHTYFSQKTREKIYELAEKKVFWIFLMVGSSPHQRLELIEALEPALRRNWLKGIPAKILQNTLRSLKTLPDCHRASKLLHSYGSMRKWVNRDFLDQIRRDDLPFERYWHLRGRNYEGLAKVKACPENAMNLLTGRPEDEYFLKKMFRRFSDYDRMPWKIKRSASETKKQKVLTFEKPEDALRWLKPFRLKRLLRGGPVHSKLLMDTVKEVRKSMPKEWFRHYASILIKSDPLWFARSFKGELTQLEWQMISKREEFWDGHQESSDLFMDHAKISRWKEKEWRVPAALQKATSQDLKLAKWCLDQNPKASWDLAKKFLPWWERLPHALSNPDKAKTLEKEIPRDRWVEGLEKVKVHYPPNIAAAMEIALQFGLRYGSFLAQAAKHLKLGHDESVSGSECDSQYHTYHIPKQSGGNRLITAPSKTLKHFQRALVDLEMNRWPLETSATGFRPGSSVVENAFPHVGKRLVVNVDLKGFFPNTKFPLILKVLHHRFHKRLSPRAIRLLTVLCSYGGGLPTGAPTSPAIANQILSSADRSISKAAQHKDVHYTRYADDLTLSGDDHAPVKLLPFVEEVIGKLGYELDPKKTNLFRKGRRQCVTGLVVNQKPNLAKPLRRRLRAAVHHFVNKRPMQWHGRPMNLTQLLGRIGFLAQTQPEEAKRLRNLIGS
jgi:retron-type reverse transcriptase